MIDLAALTAGESSARANPGGTPTASGTGHVASGSVRPPPPSAHPSVPPPSSSGVKTRESLVPRPNAPPPDAWSSAGDLAMHADTAPRAAGSSAAFQPPPETARPTSLTAHPQGTRHGSTVWIALVGGVAVGAVAAVLAFKLRSGDFVPSMHGVTNAPATIATATAPPAAATDGWKASDTHGSSADHGVAASSLPLAQPTSVTPAPAIPAAPGRAAAATPPAGPVSQKAAAAQPAPAPRAAAPDTTPAPAADSPPANPNSLEAMMKRAVRAESPQTAAPPPVAAAAPAAAPAAPAGNLPLKPAMGAVMGALGAVMPAARYCLGPDDPVSRATITFKSDGSVENVAIAGDAAGQPAEACIRARLLEAKVPPFSTPRFTWTVPVRPAN